MTIISCDKCGKEIKNKSGMKMKLEDNANIEYDICVECVGKIKEFIEQ